MLGVRSMKAKYKLLVMLYGLGIVLNLDSAQAGPVVLPDNKFDLYIESVLKETHGAGVAVGVVSDGKLSWAKGYGYRNIEKKDPVTPQTVFTIGSISKSFTSSLSGILVDQGKMSWDTPIQTVLPEFQMVHDSSSKKVSLAHLLSHQTGLPRHDFIWLFNDRLKRTDILRQLPYLEALPQVGQKFLYNNLMYTIAGIAQERVTEKTWEQLMDQEIFKPLDMKNSSSNYAQLLNQEDHALPYSVNPKNETVLTLPVTALDTVGPAGSVNSNIKDLSQYALLHLNEGKLPGSKPLISSQSFNRIHSRAIEFGRDQPVAQLLFSKIYPNETIHYQLGWFESRRHGLQIVEHSGGTRGYAAELLLVPERGISVIVLSNSDLFPAVFLAHDILDHLLEKEPKEFALTFNREFKEKLEKGRLTSQESNPPLNLTPVERREVSGDYDHEGQIFPFSVAETKKGLEFVFQGRRIPFVPKGNNDWGLETEDSILQYFVFHWDSVRNGFYLKPFMESEGTPMAFFGKKLRIRSSL
jgi:CubicO group peptidase (beta-lactamase class C family)